MDEHNEPEYGEEEYRQDTKDYRLLNLIILRVSCPDETLEELVERFIQAKVMLSANTFGLDPLWTHTYEMVSGEKLQDISAEEIQLLTGHTDMFWQVIFRENSSAIQEAIEDKSKVWALPDPIWDYIAGTTSLSREEWQEMPSRIEEKLNAEFNCPSCKTRLTHKRMIDFHEGPQMPVERVKAGKTYLGKEGPDKLHFNCPVCKAQFVWSMRTNQTAIEPNPIGKGAGCLASIFFLFYSIL